MRGLRFCGSYPQKLRFSPFLSTISHLTLILLHFVFFCKGRKNNTSHFQKNLSHKAIFSLAAKKKTHIRAFYGLWISYLYTFAACHITSKIVRKALEISILSILMVKYSFFTEVMSVRLPNTLTSTSNGKSSFGINRT